MDDLENVLPAEWQVVTVGGELIEVTPLTIGQLPAFTRALRPCLAQFDGAGDGGVDIAALLAEHGEHIIEAVAVAVRRPREWVSALPADEFIALAEKIMEVNADFFLRRVLPALTSATQRITSMVGRTPSNASSPTGTATRT